MPKLKPSEQEARNRIVRACISSRMEIKDVNDELIAKKLGVTYQTVRNRRNSPENFTLREIQELNKTLSFTPFQAASMVLGRELTAKEIREFILM